MNSNKNQNNQEERATEEVKIDKNPNELKENTIKKEVESTNDSGNIEDLYKFGWSSYSEITNGRFAMIGFLSIVLIELFSKHSFLHWAGIIN